MRRQAEIFIRQGRLTKKNRAEPSNSAHIIAKNGVFSKLGWSDWRYGGVFAWFRLISADHLTTSHVPPVERVTEI
jgi:hypothetical protein